MVADIDKTEAIPIIQWYYYHILALRVNSETRWVFGCCK